MKEINNIIVPIDFLSHTDQIAEYAVYIAEKFGASLKFVHVIEPPQSFADQEYPSLGSYTAELVQSAEEKMKQLVEQCRNNISGCEGTIFKGNTVDTLVKYVQDKEGDLIIIGTHGRKGLSKMWLGSVAERVIKSAPCPTLTCNPYKETL